MNDRDANSTPTNDELRAIHRRRAKELMPDWARAKTDTDVNPQLKAWIAAYRTWFLQSPRARSDAALKNNHGTWYDVQAIAFSLYVGDAATSRNLLEEAKASRDRLNE